MLIMFWHLFTGGLDYGYSERSNTYGMQMQWYVEMYMSMHKGRPRQLAFKWLSRRDYFLVNFFVCCNFNLLIATFVDHFVFHNCFIDYFFFKKPVMAGSIVTAYCLCFRGMLSQNNGIFYPGQKWWDLI